ncbi:MAG: NADH:flavin oxidoreductase/NADH oxidase [Thermoplasmata archaeon]
MKLFEKASIKNLNSKNRIMMSPMAMYSAKDGLANDFHFVHYGSRAVGGAGIIMVEATAVEKIGMITPSDLGLYNMRQMRALSRIASFIRQNDSIAGIQLAHAGRKAGTHVPWEGFGRIPLKSGGWIPVAPSPIPYVKGWPKPKELDLKGIDRIKGRFAYSAKLAVEAGFQIIEIHAAHGYLIHEFLSPVTNKRNDRYGGDIENRSRLLLEIIDEIKGKIQEDIPIFVRISGVDFLEGGWGIEDTLYLAGEMKKHGVDLVDCSSGGIVPDVKLPEREGYNVFISEVVKKTGIMTSVVGYIFNEKFANSIIERGKLISLPWGGYCSGILTGQQGKVSSMATDSILYSMKGDSMFQEIFMNEYMFNLYPPAPSLTS